MTTSGATRRAGRNGLVALTLWLAILPVAATAQTGFPPLTGRVVDGANLLSRERIAELETLLADHETQTTNQVVIVSVPSLQGRGIEDFSRRLLNHWGIGQKARNNGVLLVVAPNQRKVRIEVGDGLEQLLTGTAAQRIIDNQILPRFKEGRFEQGIVDGTYGMIDVLMSRVDFQDRSGKGLDVGGILFVVLFFGFLAVALYRKRRRRRREAGSMPPVVGNPEDGPAASTRDDFNGGGGSGGGGASGGW